MPWTHRGLCPWASASWRWLSLLLPSFFCYDLERYLSLEALTPRDALLAFAEATYGTSVAVFIMTYALITAVSRTGAAIMTLAGGFLFGSVLGTLYVNIAAASGATLAFLAARYLLRERVATKFGQRMDSFQRGFAENAFNYVMTLRLIPISPLLSRQPALRPSPGSGFRLTCWRRRSGSCRAASSYAYAGRQLGGLNSMADIATPRVLLAFTLLGLLALAPVLYHRLRFESFKRE